MLNVVHRSILAILLMAIPFHAMAASRPNRPPVLAPIGDKSVNEGNLLKFTISATDPDGGKLTYSTTGLPSGASFDPRTQTFTWPTTEAQDGTYSVTFSVSDGKATTSETVKITLFEVNQSPALAPIGDKSANVSNTLSFTVSATDGDLVNGRPNTLVYTASELPAGASLDPTTRLFTWKPVAGQEGAYSVIFSVSDGAATASETITMTCSGAWAFDATLSVAEQQLLDTTREVTDISQYPRSTEPVSGLWITKTATDWTSGFYPGQLWTMYEATGNAALRTAGEQWLTKLAGQATRTDTHDVGFIIYNSFGQAYRITGSQTYKQTLLTAASSLATRFDPDVGAIRSWDTSPFNVIIDNMMNLQQFPA